MEGSRLTLEAICSGLRIIKAGCERQDEDFDIVFTEGEYGKGQHRIEVSFCRLLSEAVELLKEQQQIINSLKSDLQETLKVVSEQSNVIRCKDCKHRDPEDGKCDSGHGIQWQLPRPDDWFCADGEPRTEV